MPETGRLSDLPAPAEWEQLLTRDLLPRRDERRTWSLDKAARHSFESYQHGWKREARETSGATAAALVKADVHLLRVALVLAEAEQPGGAGEAGSDLIDRAAVIVNFVLDSSAGAAGARVAFAVVA